MSFVSGVSFGQKNEPAPKEDPTIGRYSLIGADAAAERRRSVTLPASILLHSAAALALVVVPLLTAESGPEVAAGVRAFLVEPLAIAPPPPRANVRTRLYALADARRSTAPGAFEGTLGEAGGELIWAPTANSLLEATVNTDFAQADVDRQVVNLTRFNVFFPEQRQFFLENADLLTAGVSAPTSPTGVA